MATMSTLSQTRRRKPLTYGKSARSVNTWNLDSLDALDEDELSIPNATIERKASVKEVYPVQKHKTKPHTSKAGGALKKKADPWDVPSSDDEKELSPIKRISQINGVTRRGGCDLPQDNEPGLAPWERTKTVAGGLELEGQSRTRSPAKSDSASGLSSSSLLSEKRKTDLATAEDTQKAKKQVTLSQARDATPQPTSAAARLQARKLQAEQHTPGENDARATGPLSAHKRSSTNEDFEITPRKRPRFIKHSELANGHAIMEYVPLPACGAATAKKHKAISEDPNVYDLPGTSDNEPSNVRSMSKGNARRQRVDKVKSRILSPARHTESAPAMLSDMVPMEIDDYESTPQQPPNLASKNATPRELSPSARRTTPPATARSNRSMTPKQTQLWNTLLPSEPRETSPSVLPLQDLSLQSRRSLKTSSPVPRPLAQSKSDVGRRRTRLVDRLKASAPSSEASSSSSEGSDGDDEIDDVEMVNPAADREPRQSAEPEMQHLRSQDHYESQPQTYSQNSNTAKSGPKITYGRTRSYVAEESFEDGLMLDLQSDITPRPAPLLRRNTTQDKMSSQKSEFDMEDSEDEGAAGRLRTIHELRAVGGNQRFMDDISGVLEDISDHRASARSRRRSALIDLGTKLTDKAYLEKFLRQGYEQQLIAECIAKADDISDFALAAAFTLVLVGDVSEHVLQAMNKGGLLTWLLPMMDVRTDAKQLAKDRSNNMSKSAQRAFANFCNMLMEQQSIWSDWRPHVISPRTIALKACDCLIGKLRRSADRTELIDAQQIRQLLPTEEEIASIEQTETSVDLIVAISALESLSTAALSLVWPVDVIERLSLLLVSSCLRDRSTEHLLFLTLRLCLNLTNGNVRNCRIFSKPSTVMFTLRSIQEGFDKLDSKVEEQQQNLNLDLLVLSMGIFINLSEHNDRAREHAALPETTPHVDALVDIFQQGQRRLMEAESVEQSITNVAYGYLAVVLANLCRHPRTKKIIASKLPNGNLNALVEALSEFVVHHQKVDTMNFAGEEGVEVWSAFTEQLKGVLARLHAEAQADGSM